MLLKYFILVIFSTRLAHLYTYSAKSITVTSLKLVSVWKKEVCIAQSLNGNIKLNK